jgi:hypothetical protein
VHVITGLGPADRPGLVVPAQLLGPHIHGTPIFYYDPFADEPPRHTNHRCNPMPHP